MDKDLFKGFKIGVGFLLTIGLLFGIVYAVGFHTANEIISGTFLGNYTFTNNVIFNGDANFTNANVSGISSNLLNNGAVCSNSTKGKLRYSSINESIDVCNGNKWKLISNIYDYSSCKSIFDEGNSVGDGLYNLQFPNGSFKQAYCDMTTDGGGWTLIVRQLSTVPYSYWTNSSEVNNLTSPTQTYIGKYSDDFINNIANINDAPVFRQVCNGIKTYYKLYNNFISTISIMGYIEISVTNPDSGYNQRKLNQNGFGLYGSDSSSPNGWGSNGGIGPIAHYTSMLGGGTNGCSYSNTPSGQGYSYWIVGNGTSWVR